MPRYKITSETDLDEYFGFGEPKKTTAERHFGEQNIPSLGHYTVPKPRSEKDRARALEVDEDITRHVPLSDRSWYRSTIAAKDATMGDAALNADLPREPVVQRKSRVQKIFKNSDYSVPDYTPGSYSKSLYGYGKGSGKDIETSLAEVRAEKEAAKKAANDRLKKEWQVEPPKCLLSGMSGKDADMYSIADYLAIQEAEEAEMEAQFEQMSTYKPFKTRKQIRKEKYGVDEDADEILLDRIAIPRRKDHERGGLADVDSLAERHKNLVGDILERRQARLARAQEIIDAANESDEEDLLVDVRSEKWLSQGSTKEMPAGKYFTQQKSEIKLDTLEDLLNYCPYGNGPITSAEDDLEALEKLKPKTYKAMEDPHFMKSKYKSLYAPIKSAEEYDTQKLLKQAAFLSAQCAPFEVEDSD